MPPEEHDRSKEGDLKVGEENMIEYEEDDDYVDHHQQHPDEPPPPPQHHHV